MPHLEESGGARRHPRLLIGVVRALKREVDTGRTNAEAAQVQPIDAEREHRPYHVKYRSPNTWPKSQHLNKHEWQRCRRPGLG